MPFELQEAMPHYEYLISHDPQPGGGLAWALLLDGRIIARFASRENAEANARFLAGVDREAGRSPTIRLNTPDRSDDREPA